MNRLILVAVALALTACASQPSGTSSTAQSAQPREEKEFRTGSRIPVRDTTTSSPTTTMDASAMSPGVPPARTN